MLEYESKVRISNTAFEKSTIFLYVLATIAATLRFIIRLRFQKLAWLDDGFFLFAFMLMTACFGLLFNFVDDLYISWALANGYIRTQISLPEILALTTRFHKYTDIFIIPAWTGIVAVKFSFLFFFRSLIQRTRKLKIFWWFAVIFTASSWAAGSVAEIFACPRFDARVLKCGTGKYLQGTIAVAVFVTVVDVVSDLMIISIPVLLLRKAQIPLHIKVYLGCSLCLSAILIVVTLIRVSGLENAPEPGHKNVDSVWQVYWQFAELCIAVMVVSATAFRTLFVQTAASSNQKPRRMKSWYSSYSRKGWKRSHSQVGDFEFQLPQVPAAKMTGMRTFIDEEGKTTRGDSRAVLKDVWEETSLRSETLSGGERDNTPPESENGLPLGSILGNEKKPQQHHGFV